MNATNKIKSVSWLNSTGFVFRQRRISVAVAFAGISLLGFALAAGHLVPLGETKTRVTKPVSARHQTVLPTDLECTDSRKSDSILTATPDGDLEVIRELVLDGLEFAVVSAELSNQFGPYRQIGSTISWFAQELSRPEGASIVAKTQPNDASLVANRLLSPTEKEMAKWLLQNLDWTH